MAYKFKKRGTYLTLEDYVREKTGKSIRELNHYPDQYRLEKIPLIADKIMEGMKQGKKFYIFADYDVDGITSAGQFATMFNYFHYPCTVKVPMRLTDGYGMKVKHAEAVDADTILILVDNGISAIDAVKEAKKNGAYVIVMDHHLADRREDGSLILPEADILLDPEVLAEGNDFCDYCGSSLTNKLVNYMVKDTKILQICSAMAAFGTIADVVPLREDNRRIVQEGLFAINRGHLTQGLKALVNCLELTGHVNAEDIAFYLGPLINAAGRLYDRGGTWSALTITNEDPEQSMSMAIRLKEINQERKDIVAKTLETVPIDQTCSVNVIRVPDGAPEGVLGLIAGKMTEETGKPTFAYTKVSDTLCKGSARSDNEEANQVHLMLAGIKEKLAGFGGHPGAAGFSFPLENEAAIREYLSNYPVVPHDNTPYYDLTIRAEDLIPFLNQMNVCEPFGKALEKPMVRMTCNFTTPEYWKRMGTEGNHIRFILPGQGEAKAVGFNMKERYLFDKAPRNIYLYGYPSWNWYKGKCYPQFLIEDYEKI